MGRQKLVLQCNSSYQSTTYSETEPLLKNEIIFKAATSDHDTIPAGDHEYPFTFKLPNCLPSTFKGTNGYIAYEMTALIDRPLWRLNYKSELTFKIINPIDLNLSPVYKGPFTFTASKNMSCCGFRNLGQMLFTVAMASRGFVAGQMVRLHVDVKNFSSVPVKKMSCKLTQEITAKSRNLWMTRRNKKVVCRSDGCGIGANEERQVVMEMDIPKDHEVPNFDWCGSLFAITYTLEVTAIPRGLHFNLSDSTEVLLGHIPLFDNSNPFE